MEKFDPEINIGEIIRERIEGYVVRATLPKRKLKKHPASYILCPDFMVTIPKVLTREESEASHKFTVKIVTKTRAALKKALGYMIACAAEDIIADDKRFELCGFHQSTVKIGMHMAGLTYTFKLRQLSYEELKQIKLKEEKNG